MLTFRQVLVLFVLMLPLAACSLPRGAALQSEILQGKDTEETTFSVVPVTGDSVGRVNAWPVTGWKGHYRWLKASRGPASNLINTGDMLEIVVWDNQPNSLLTTDIQRLVSFPPMTVAASGAVFVPYVGDVVVRGLTRNKAREKIQAELDAIAPSAQIQVNVTPGRNNAVDVVNGVAKPGSYPLADRNTSILSVLASAGGISESLRNPLVRLQRGASTYEIRAGRLLETASADVLLRGGDQIVVVEDDRYFTALGATGSEKVIDFDKEEITAMDALSSLGGLSDNRADPKGVLILRDYEADQLRTDGTGPDMARIVFTVDLTSADGLFAARKFRINPRDTVVATESPVTAARTVFQLVGSLVGLTRSIDSLGN